MKLRNMRTKLLAGTSTLVFLFLWGPVIVLVLFSFSADKLGLRWEGFTLQWYAALFDTTAALDALKTSLTIASITVVITTIAGTLTAYGLYKYKFRGRRLIRTSILLPLVMPPVVIGAALLVFFIRLAHIPLGIWSVVIAHVTIGLPLAVFVVLGRMQRIDWTLEEASMDLGGNKLTTWRKITIPMLLPAILASAALIFPWSFDDFTITYFVSGVGKMTLPIYVFSQLRYGATPIINTIGAIFVVLPLIGVLAMNFLQRKEFI